MSNKAMGPTNLTYLWSKIKDYVSNNSGQIPEVNHGTSDTTFTLTPNVMHIWGTVSSLTLSLPTDSNSVLDEYMFTFTSGSTPTTLSLPSTVKWVQDIEVEANKTYQVSIINNLAGWLTNGMPSGGGSGGGGENNVIESISVNGVEQTVSSKNVNLQFKTINNNDITGTGNITVSGGGSSISVITMKARWSGSTLTNFTFDEPATAFDTINGIQSPSDLLNIFFVVETGITNNNQFVSDEHYMIMRIVDNADSSIYCSTYSFFEKYSLEIFVDEENQILSVTDVYVDSSGSSSHILSSEVNEYDPGRDLYYIDGTSASDSDAHDLLLENAWVIHDGAYYYLISSSTSSGTINYYLATFDKTNSRITVKTIPWRTSQQDFYYTNYNYYSLSGSGEANVIESISVNNVAQTVTNKNVNITVPTKVSDLTNDSGFTSNTGTITGINMNGASKGTSGVVDLGTVLTAHQDISGKADKATTLAGYGITNAYTKTEIDSNFYALNGGTNLNPSSSNTVDLNLLDAPNSYYTSSTSGITYISNLPINQYNTFRIWVSATGSDGVSRRQRLQFTETNEVWERYSTAYVSQSGGSYYDWSNWKLVQDNLSNKPNIYTGSSAPSSSTGSNGDIYIQTS